MIVSIAASIAHCIQSRDKLAEVDKGACQVDEDPQLSARSIQNNKTMLETDTLGAVIGDGACEVSNTLLRECECGSAPCCLACNLCDARSIGECRWALCARDLPQIVKASPAECHCSIDWHSDGIKDAILWHKPPDNCICK